MKWNIWLVVLLLVPALTGCMRGDEPLDTDTTPTPTPALDPQSGNGTIPAHLGLGGVPASWALAPGHPRLVVEARCGQEACWPFTVALNGPNDSAWAYDTAVAGARMIPGGLTFDMPDPATGNWRLSTYGGDGHVPANPAVDYSWCAFGFDFESGQEIPCGE